MITVIPRKITATSVNGVAVANDGSITLPVDSTPTSNSTNLVTSGGVKTELDALTTGLAGKQNTLIFDSTPTSGSTNPVTSGGVKTELDALSARIGNTENPAQVWADVSFTIPTSSWSLSNNKYTATVQSSSILATSGVFVNYNDLDNAITPIIAEESTGQVTFTTETIPSGTITGTFRIIDSVNGIIPMERGGTGVAATSNNNLLTQLGAASTSALTTGLADAQAAMGIVQDGDTATQTIAKGQYVIWHGMLYIADSAIAYGTALASSGGSKNLTAVENGGLNLLSNKLPKAGYKNITIPAGGSHSETVLFDTAFPAGTSYSVQVTQADQYAYADLFFGSTDRSVNGFKLNGSSNRSASITLEVMWAAIPF